MAAWLGSVERIEAAVDVALWKAAWLASGLPLEAGPAGHTSRISANSSSRPRGRRWPCGSTPSVAVVGGGREGGCGGLGIVVLDAGPTAPTVGAKIAGLRNGTRPDLPGDLDED